MRPRDVVVSVVLLVVGFATCWIYLRSRHGPTASDITTDAIALSQGLRADLELRGETRTEFDAAWERRRPTYSEDELARLREKLTAFLDFQVAEYADAKDTYLSGRVPDRPSMQAVVAQGHLKEAFGAAAAAMIQQYKDRVREAAYRASPAVARGRDPDLLEYDKLYDDIVMRWLPGAQATIARLTSPAR